MARLNKHELDALNQVIVEKLIQRLTTQANGKIKKHPKYKQFQKLIKEYSQLQNKLYQLYEQKNEIIELENQHRNKNIQIRELIQSIVLMNNMAYECDVNGNIKINWINEIESKIQNDLVLMNINSDVNVQGLIDQLVEKYSKV